jgi:uncharacterized protein
MPVTLDDLRRMAVTQSLFTPTTLKRALQRLQFVQADPIRAPARAQDLILRHRVKDYCAGDLERHYAKLGVEEDFFVNYGFVTRELQALMHPRSHSAVPAAGCMPWPAAPRKLAQMLLEFVRERGPVHPKQVDAHFAHGIVKNYWGGRSNATTHLLDNMHYQGLLRVVRRDAGIRVYAAHEHAAFPLDETAVRSRLDALATAAIRIYAPLPLPSLRFLLRRLRFAVPQWSDEVTATIQRAKERLAHVRVDGVEWCWPMEWKHKVNAADNKVRLLAPFDPVVWDRGRFERLWGWIYRFEAYTPPAKRRHGYYALPLLWNDRVIGWANLATEQGKPEAHFGYVESTPRDRVFQRERDAELERIRIFLGNC